jgi:hypothetical protein
MQKMAELSGYLLMSIERCGSQMTGSLPVPAILELINECFVDHVSGLLSLATEKPNLAVHLGSETFEIHFDKVFVIGPGGLDLIINTLNVIYRFVDSDRLPSDDTSFNVITEIFHIADNISKASLKCLQHLRMKHPRRLWDPKAFRNYGDRYEMSGHMLSV